MNVHLRHLLVIAAGLPYMALPLVQSDHGRDELSWLQILSVSLFGVAVVLAAAGSGLTKLRKLTEFRLPRLVQYVALGALALAVLSTMRND